MKDPLRDELEFYLEERTQEGIAQGLPEAEARARAEAAFGDRAQVEAECARIERRRARRSAITGLWGSVWQGVRGLTRQPTYAALVVGTLALGIGATVAIFSVVNAVLLQPLPFDDPDALVTVWEADSERAFRNPSPADFVDLRTAVAGFADVSAYLTQSGNLIGDGPPERVRFADVSANFFQTLGVDAVLGRTFGPATVDEGARLAVIGHALWTRRFENDPGVLGRTLSLDGESYQVVGVAPEGFAYPDEALLWTAASFDIPGASFFGAEAPLIRDAWYHSVVARLDAGVSAELARSQLDALGAQLRATYPEAFGDAEFRIGALKESEVGDLNTPLLLLLGATALVLLIVAANVANLALIRAAGRAREWGVRRALGAPKSRIVALVLAEALGLAALGGLLGVGLAWLGVELMRPTVDPLLPATSALAIDGAVLGFAIVVAFAVAIAFGLVPALSASRSQPGLTIDRGAGARSGSRADRHLREVLVSGEIALAVVLVMGSGLLLRSLLGLQSTDLGFDPAGLTTLAVGLPGGSDRALEEQSLFYADIGDRLAQQPGVAGVAWGQFLPVQAAAGAGLRVLGRGDEAGTPSVRWHVVSQSYFPVLGIDLVDGRGFESTDRPESERVAVVNETLARQFFPDGDAVGQLVNTGLDGRTDGEWNWVRIVGVAADLKNMGPARPPEPMLYRPSDQTSPGVAGAPRTILHIRTGSGPSVVEAARRIVWDVSPDSPIDQILREGEIVGTHLGAQRIVLTLLGGFAVLAMLLGALGVYGITRFAVQKRTREIGVRMAIGAARPAVTAMVLRQGLRPAVAGLALGVVASMAAGRLIQSQLTGVSSLDPATYAVVASLLAAVSVLATWLPARRAAAIDPVRAIRSE